MDSKSFTKKIIFTIIVLMVITGGLVIIIDPFFHYHGPIGNLQPIQWVKEYQVNGALEHLDYDAVLAGSSVVMNMDNTILDDAYGCNSIKTVGSGASTDLLLFYINKAYENHDLKYVFYGIDIDALSGEYDENTTQDQVIYMKNYNPFDDVEYIYNRDVIFKYIPDMIIQSGKGWDGGMAYNFARYETFDADYTVNRYLEEFGDRIDYNKVKSNKPKEIAEDYKNNIGMIEDTVKSHPETQFIFFFPIRSVLYYDACYEKTEERYMVAEYVVDCLDKYDNVTFYKGIINDREHMTNLDNYCDWTHASYEYNCETARKLVPGSDAITANTIKTETSKHREIVEEFEEKLHKEKSYDFIR